ncbi:MAG: glucose-6-phosphate isomerase [Alphaproteobacteria bacterium]|nr:glucose-6-phosphate isomerase [Alphaproteobacteria bacterium]
MPGVLPYRQDLSRAAVITESAGFERALAAAGDGLAALRRARDDGRLPLLTLPEARGDLAMIEARAAHHREHADDVVILGTGGSSLGGQALYALADSGFGPSGNAPRLRFLDNIDSHTFDHMFRSLDLARTDFLVISKSGGTAETLLQCLICLEALVDAVGRENAASHVTVIVEPGSNPLRHLAEAWGITVIDHDPGIGGRDAALTSVGLLPAVIAGLNPAALREGAQQVLHLSLNTAIGLDTSEPALGAALNTAPGARWSAVLAVYADRLAPFAMWFRQLWAESLGKDGQGTLPAPALGAVDQHSQLQLWLDGPDDKLFTVVTAETVGHGRIVSSELVEDDRLAWLAGRSMGDLLDAEARATIETLAECGRPVRQLHLERIDETTAGALMMHFMLETILAAHVLGVDPFDQPAVERSKVLARAYLAAMDRH